MIKKYNEEGVTLLELLATITLAGIIIVLISNFFSQANEYNERETIKNQLQQESNLILNTIQQWHTKYNITEISNVTSNTESYVKIVARDKKGKPYIETFNKQNINYNIISGKFNLNEGEDSPTKIIFEMELTSGKINYKSKTTFSKLSGNN